MSKHLVSHNKGIIIKDGYKKYSRAVTMYYFEQPYYSQLMTKILQELQNNCNGYLK